jgi:membrane protease YdiL (CAAX protease family)
LRSVGWLVVSSPLRRNALRRAGARIDVPVALAAWLCGWLVANVLAVVVLSAAGYDSTDDAAIWALFLGQVLGWAAFIGAMVLASQRDGSGAFVDDYSVRVRPVDVLGAAAGVLTQLVVLPLIYLPLEKLWPDTFSSDKLSENAKDLVDRAHGGSLLLLVLMVCVGAPIVEELVYRGLLQGTFANRISQVPALLVASAWFALIHFRPVEYPGLFAAGLVFGACALTAGRLGPAMAAHLGFNITGLVLAFN